MVNATGYARFFRKAPDVDELRRLTVVHSYKDPQPYAVVAAVTMPKEQFNLFCKNLLADNEHINEFTHLCGVDIKDVVNCIAITSEESDDIILINAEGYDYGKYTAIVLKTGSGILKQADIVGTLRALSRQTPEGTDVLLPAPLYHNVAECDAVAHEDREFETFDAKFLLHFIADMME